jgi:hypothetical protein
MSSCEHISNEMSERETDQELVHELWAYHEAFRRMGFSADDIFLSFNVIDPAGREVVGVVLMTQGMEFAVSARPVEDPKAFIQLWLTFIDSFEKRERDDAELLAIWDNSHAKSSFIPLVTALQAKGIQLPIHNRSN